MNQSNTPSGGPPDLDQVFRALWSLIKRKGRRSKRDKSKHPPLREVSEASGASTEQRQDAQKRRKADSVFVDGDTNAAGVEGADSRTTQRQPNVATRVDKPYKRQSLRAHQSVLTRETSKVKTHEEESPMDLRSTLHSKQALRQAIVLMEILDRPLVLRPRRRRTR